MRPKRCWQKYIYYKRQKNNTIKTHFVQITYSDDVQLGAGGRRGVRLQDSLSPPTPKGIVLFCYTYGISHFSGVLDPDPFHIALPDPGSKISAKIMRNLHKNLPKSQEFSEVLQDLPFFQHTPSPFHVLLQWAFVPLLVIKGRHRRKFWNTIEYCQFLYLFGHETLLILTVFIFIFITGLTIILNLMVFALSDD